MKRMNNWLNTDIGLLILRIFAGALMLIMHGLQKLFSWERLFHSFSDPLGLGSEISYILTVFAEVLCSFLVIIGYLSRYAVIPLIITMLVAAFIVHGNDPWPQKEMALIYCSIFITLFFTGPGRYSIDKLRK
ncbi:MAG: DoxX family protein [Cyclobacteriaceae bacterium]